MRLRRRGNKEWLSVFGNVPLTFALLSDVRRGRAAMRQSFRSKQLDNIPSRQSIGPFQRSAHDVIRITFK